MDTILRHTSNRHRQRYAISGVLQNSKLYWCLLSVSR